MLVVSYTWTVLVFEHNGTDPFENVEGGLVAYQHAEQMYRPKCKWLRGGSIKVCIPQHTLDNPRGAIEIV